MRKLLSLLGSIGLLASAGSSVVACGGPGSSDDADKSALMILFKDGTTMVIPQDAANGDEDAAIEYVIGELKPENAQFATDGTLEFAASTDETTGVITVTVTVAKAYTSDDYTVFLVEGETAVFSTPEPEPTHDAKLSDAFSSLSAITVDGEKDQNNQDYVLDQIKGRLNSDYQGLLDNSSITVTFVEASEGTAGSLKLEVTEDIQLTDTILLKQGDSVEFEVNLKVPGVDTYTLDEVFNESSITVVESQNDENNIKSLVSAQLKEGFEGLLDNNLIIVSYDQVATKETKGKFVISASSDIHLNSTTVISKGDFSFEITLYMPNIDSSLNEAFTTAVIIYESPADVNNLEKTKELINANLNGNNGYDESIGLLDNPSISITMNTDYVMVSVTKDFDLTVNKEPHSFKKGDNFQFTVKIKEADDDADFSPEPTLGQNFEHSKGDFHNASMSKSANLYGTLAISGVTTDDYTVTVPDSVDNEKVSISTDDGKTAYLINLTDKAQFGDILTLKIVKEGKKFTLYVTVTK